jgi:hypothetical protein
MSPTAMVVPPANWATVAVTLPEQHRHASFPRVMDTPTIADVSKGDRVGK